MRLAILLLATACGRVAFDPREDAARPSDASPSDALSAIGCADGTREAFTDQSAFPTIAGCAATWPGTPSLRAPRAGGDAPVDACAPGWHICGDTGDPAEINTRITVDDCRAVTGTFVAALQHCADCTSPCTTSTECIYAATYDCGATVGPCTEPVCCGDGCDMGNVCQFTLFPSPGTHIGLTDNPCGAIVASGQDGVLCCQ